MRLSCCAYSYRQALQSGALDLFAFLSLCREIGFDGAELTAYYFPATDRAFLNEIKRHAHREGVLISGTAVGNNFANPNSEERRQHIAMTKQWIDHSVALGAPTLRVFAGGLREGADRDAAFQNVVDSLQECADHAWEQGITLALENHDGLTHTAMELLRLLDAVDHPAVEANVDAGNFVGDVYSEVAACAHRAVAVHLKVTARGTEPGTHHEVDYGRVFPLLANANYRGFCAVEYEESAPAEENVPAFFATLQKALQG